MRQKCFLIAFVFAVTVGRYDMAADYMAEAIPNPLDPEGR